MARFVLVHGAFHGAWCWEGVAAALREAGHTVTAHDLPGSGADAAAAATVTLEDCARAVCADLESSGEPAVLVAHSMGGVVATQAAALAPDSVAQVVYVAAFLPVDGESLGALAAMPEGASDQVQANLVVSGDPPVASLPAAKLPQIFYNTCSDDVAARAATRVDVQGLALFGTPASLGDAPVPTRRYVVTLQDHACPTPLQRLMAERAGCVQVVEMDTDHSPFLSAPDELVEHLEHFGS